AYYTTCAPIQKKKKTHPKPYFPLPASGSSHHVTPRELPLPRGPRPRQNNLLPATGGAETSRRELKPDDGRTRSERRCLVTQTGQFGYVVGTCSRLSSSSSCRHTTAFFFFYRFTAVDHDLPDEYYSLVHRFRVPKSPVRVRFVSIFITVSHPLTLQLYDSIYTATGRSQSSSHGHAAAPAAAVPASSRRIRVYACPVI
ncbi:hypothetical protein AGLY_002272, partial [Aphis glycines]